MKLNDAIQGFFIVRSLDLSPNTVAIYRWALERMSTYLDNPDVEKITSTQVHAFFNYLKTDYIPKRSSGDTKPLTPRSIENAWTATKSFFKWAALELNLTSRPDAHLPRPKYEKDVVNPFTDEEVATLLKACEYTRQANPGNRKGFAMRRPTAMRDMAIIWVLLDTGLRVSEVCRLNIEDVNLSNGEVRVKPYGTGQKTHSRTIVIGKNARKAVWRYLNKREAEPEAPLFITENGLRMNRNTIRVMLADLGKKAGVNKVHPHRFRHTAAIFYLRNGGDLMTLQHMLGHEKIETLKKYLLITTEDVKRVHKYASPGDHLKL